MLIMLLNGIFNLLVGNSMNHIKNLILTYLALPGVPQGSKLGSLLFNIIIDNIVSSINIKCLLYADDLNSLWYSFYRRLYKPFQ